MPHPMLEADFAQHQTAGLDEVEFGPPWFAREDEERCPVEHVVHSRKVKLDGVQKSHAARVVRRGPEGGWLFSPAGTLVSGSDGSAMVQPADGVQFYPAHPLPESGGRFVAWCWAVSPEPPTSHWTAPWISVDIAAARDEPLSFLDLELDLWCSAEGEGIVDAEDLDAAEGSGLVDATTADVARLAAEELYRTLRSGYPGAFGGLGWRLLAQARQRPADEK